MSQVGISVHMNDDTTTADASFSGEAIECSPGRFVCFVYIGQVALFFESLAQIDEVSAVLDKARAALVAKLPSPIQPEPTEVA